MEQEVFMLRLKPGGLEEYRRLHSAVWPELEEKLRESGLVSMRIFECDPILVVFSECDEAGTWEAVWGSEVHKRWDALMEPLLAYDERGHIDASTMREVYRLG